MSHKIARVIKTENFLRFIVRWSTKRGSKVLIRHFCATSICIGFNDSRFMLSDGSNEGELLRWPTRLRGDKTSSARKRRRCSMNKSFQSDGCASEKHRMPSKLSVKNLQDSTFDDESQTKFHYSNFEFIHYFHRCLWRMIKVIHVCWCKTWRIKM